MTKSYQNDPDIVEWWDTLSDDTRCDVMDWIERNPPDPEWKWDEIAWAYTECPKGVVTGRYGHLI